MIRRLRARLSYANGMATIAVFIALGGTSYAVTALPRNSVGSAQIRSKAVGSSEIRSGSNRSKHIHDRSVRLRDISTSARNSLRGAQGPQGPAGPAGIPLSATVDAAGTVVSGTGGRIGLHNPASGDYDIRFDRDLRACVAVATLSRVSTSTPAEPEAGEITASTNATGVLIRTRNSSGVPTDLPFHLIVVC